MYTDMRNLLMSDDCNFREGGNHVSAKTRQDRLKIFCEAKILPHMFLTQIVISPFYGKKLQNVTLISMLDFFYSI